MAIILEHPEADKLARKLRSFTGESITQVILVALRERLERETIKHASSYPLSDELLQIGRECAALPVQDHRTADEILGYTPDGAFD